MNFEAHKKIFAFSSAKIVWISIICFVLLMLAVTTQIGYTLLVYDKVYNGIYINDIHVGGMSRSEVESLLKKNIKDRADKLVLTLKAKNFSENIKYSDIELNYDIQDAVNLAYSVGRRGNIFARINDILTSSNTGKTISISYTYDEGKVQKAIDSLYLKTFISVKEPGLLIYEDKAILSSGQSGQSIDKDKALNEVDYHIKTVTDGDLEIPVAITAPCKIDIDDYYNRINRETKNASVQVENNKIVIISEVSGRSIDKAALSVIASELANIENSEKTLPVVFTKPQLTVETINAMLFKDILASANTQFYTYTENDANRGENIRIASAKINGKILAPGEVFSFNDIVGPRTEENGYKVAHVYSDGKVIDDIGGGICQVSTTLYNAVLYADMDINERVNHMFTVGYIPKGRDAAVAYNSVDFKFTNSTNWPIMLESAVSNDNRIYFTIKGTNETPGKSVEIMSEIVKTLDFQTKYTDDPSRADGETAVKTEGMTGYVVDTFKIVKLNGKVLNQSKLHRSIYRPLDREILRGTKKQQPVQVMG